jgi:uncharacterized Zn ribbon protein
VTTVRHCTCGPMGIVYKTHPLDKAQTRFMRCQRCARRWQTIEIDAAEYDRLRERAGRASRLDQTVAVVRELVTKGSGR